MLETRGGYRNAIDAEQAQGRENASSSISSNIEERGKIEEVGADGGTKVRDRDRNRRWRSGTRPRMETPGRAEPR